MDLGVAPRTTTKIHVLQIDSTMCSKHDARSKLNIINIMGEGGNYMTNL